MAASRQAQSGPVRPSQAQSGPVLLPAPAEHSAPAQASPACRPHAGPGCECLGARAESRQALTRDLHPTPLADWGAPGDRQQMGQGGPSPVTWESPKAGRRVHGAQLGSGAALGLGTPPPSTHSSPLRLQKGACPQGARGWPRHRPTLHTWGPASALGSRGHTSLKPEPSCLAKHPQDWAVPTSHSEQARAQPSVDCQPWACPRTPWPESVRHAGRHPSLVTPA